MFKPKVCLEIGVEAGITSAYMCEAAKSYGGLVIGIDHRHDTSRLATVILPTEYYYIYILDDSRDAIRKVKAIIDTLGPKPIGMVYQDSSHHYQASIDEWNLYSPLVSGLWICDDITSAFHDPKVDPPGMGMVQYWEGLPGEKRLFENVLHYGNTQGIVICE